VTGNIANNCAASILFCELPWLLSEPRDFALSVCVVHLRVTFCDIRVRNEKGEVRRTGPPLSIKKWRVFCTVFCRKAFHLTFLKGIWMPNNTVRASSALAYGPYSLTSASFRMIARIYSCSAFFLHLLTPIDFRSFSIQSNHLKFGLPTFLLPSGFPRNTLVAVLSSEVFTRWPAPSSLLAFIVVTIYGFLYITCNSSLFRILQAFWSFIGPYFFLVFYAPMF
jgi:hypothetical protein